MGIINWFKQLKPRVLKAMTRFKELGSFTARFSSFGTEIYASDIVRDCIRPLAEHTSKANAKCTDKRVEKILNLRPNKFMNGKDFLAKVRTHLELKNTAFIYISRDDKGHCIGLYPVPYSSYEAWEYENGLFIKFFFNGENRKDIVLPWEDLAALRKDYNKSDIGGDTNEPIIPMLELINVSNQGVQNAVKATANLRGILKSTKSMLSPEDVKAQKDAFVKDYLNLENEGGIASLDSTQEFIPITMSPVITSYAQMKEFRENVYRYFGVNDSIITSDYTETQLEAFYEARIEPFLVALGLELTYKIFTERELGFGNQVIYESSRIQCASNATKLAMVALVDRGALTPNEWRALFNLAPVDGGDVPIRRLDTATVSGAGEENKDDQE